MVQKLSLLLFLITSFLVEITVWSEIPLVYEGEVVGCVLEELDSNHQSKSSGVVGVILDPEDILKDVSYLSLGSCSKTFLSRELGNLIGRILSSKGYDFCICGRVERLRRDVKDPWNYVSSSPYMVSTILRDLYLGLISAGVFPVMDGRYGLNESVITSLRMKKFFPGVLLDDEDEVKKLKELNYIAPILLLKDGKIYFEFPSHPADIMRLKWKDVEWKKEELERLRMDILSSSIVLVKRSRVERIKVVEGEDVGEDRKLGLIVLKDPFRYDPRNFGGMVVVFSDDEEIIEMAKDILRGKKNPTGRRAW